MVKNLPEEECVQFRETTEGMSKEEEEEEEKFEYDEFNKRMVKNLPEEEECAQFRETTEDVSKEDEEEFENDDFTKLMVKNLLEEEECVQFRETKEDRSKEKEGFEYDDFTKPMVRNLPEENDCAQFRETTEDMSKEEEFEYDGFTKRLIRFLQRLRNQRKGLAEQEEASSDKTERSETNINDLKSNKEEESDYSSNNNNNNHGSASEELEEETNSGSGSEEELEEETNSGSGSEELEEETETDDDNVYEEWVPLYLKNNNKMEEWDSDSDLVFDTYKIDVYPSDHEDYDVRAAEGSNYDIYVKNVALQNDEEYDDQFLDHYFSVCKSRGYDLDTVPPPENMHWSSWDWIHPYPMDSLQDKQEINDALQEALVVIHEKTGKKLKLEQIVKVNLWHKYTGRHFFITFEATDEHSTKGTYQTRLVLDWEDCTPSRSFRLINFVGDPGRVHAFRPKPA